MGIWVNKKNRILIQGITGKTAQIHLKDMLDYGTRVVAGVSPSQQICEVQGIPVFSSVEKAKRETRCDTSLVFVPAPFAADAMVEAALAGITTIVCITEHIPIQDMLRVKQVCDLSGVRLIGPNCPGILTTDGTKLGIMPASIFKRGSVGVVSRSGTLTYEVVDLLCKGGYGISTAVGIGGDPVIGSSFKDALFAFEHDPETKIIVLIGEIGGRQEQDAAQYIWDEITKPVLAFISGKTAPKGKRMGHAGAIISGEEATAYSKEKTLREKGIPVAESFSELLQLVRRIRN